MRRVTLVALILCALTAPAAQASYPGANGKILLDVYGSSSTDIWSINPDGTGATNLTNTASIYERGGSWSPDGTKIAFIVYPGVWVMNADGSGRVEITPDVSGPPFYDAHVQARSVAWSPDGDKIAISNDDGCAPNHSPGQVILVNTDGSNPTQVVCRWPHIPAGTFKGAGATGASWHPNGQKLAVAGPVDASCNGPNVWTVNSDGTDMTDVTFGDAGPELDPDWAPDGSKIVFEENGDCGSVNPLATINPDGSQKTPITGPPPPTDGFSPVWSPDRARIIYARSSGLWVVNADGTGATNLTAATGVQGAPTSWLAIPNNAYARPRGATPTRVSLVTAYNQCTAPDRTHGPPLAFGSCASPQKSSSQLTVGTGDANGKPALNEGYLTLGVRAGTPGGPDDSDVILDFFLDDVFTNALADYTGEVRAHVSLRITDRLNTPNPGGPGAATTVEIPLDMTVACLAVADPNEGSTCATGTTVDALVPGAVPEGRRAIWQLGTVEVYDGGADSDANTPAGDTLFARQGVFIP